MRLFLHCFLLFVSAGALARADGPPPPADTTEFSSSLIAMAEAPLLPQPTRLQQMKYMIKAQVNRAIDGKPYPTLSEWKPLTPRQKFDVFLHSTYAPRTLANAAIDEAADWAKGRRLNREYETGALGVGQAYGINLATNETDVRSEERRVGKECRSRW